MSDKIDTIVIPLLQSMQKDIGGLKQDVAVLKQDVGGLKQDVAVLKQDVSMLKDAVRRVDGRCARIEAFFPAFHSYQYTQQVEIDTLRDQISLLEEKIRN